MTSLSIATGAKSLISIGLSLGDIALLINHGRNYGNWFRATKNESELLDSIMEDHEAVLRRKGLVDTSRMASLWPEYEMLVEGRSIRTEAQYVKIEELSALSWFMATLISALDTCMPQPSIIGLLIEVWVEILGGGKDLEDSLRVQLPTNVQSWRSVSAVRKMSARIAKAVSSGRSKYVAHGEANSPLAIPQLNNAERKEAKKFLVWLMEGKTYDFDVLSATVMGIAQSLHTVGFHVKIGGRRQYDSQPIVRYIEDASVTPGMSDTFRAQLKIKDFLSLHLSVYDSSFEQSQGRQNRAQLITYPRGKPSAMIEAIPALRPVLNRMSRCWELGVMAAKPMVLRAFAGLPLSPGSEIYYEIEEHDPETSSFSPELGLLATHAFPRATQGVLKGLEWFAEGVKRKQMAWLSQHTELEFLLQTEHSLISHDEEEIAAWLQYQAMVFGFYYALLEPLVSLDHVRHDVFFRGVWGYGSTTFLAACSQLGQHLRRTSMVDRTHVLHLVAMMYGGRFKIFTEQKSRIGLQAIMGPISITTLPLLETTDDPKQIARFAIVETPIVDLLPDQDGELYAGTGCDVVVRFEAPNAPLPTVSVHGPKHEWSIHAKMGALFGDGQPGVVMAARCNGTLVGWFSPLAADVMFLSSCYQHTLHTNDSSYKYADTLQDFFEVTEQDWQSGRVQRAGSGTGDYDHGVVHSRGCPALRYAAAGIYAGIGEEVSIATDDLMAAADRFSMFSSGVVIA